MESKIMTLVEESCVISARTDSDDQNESKKEQNLSQARIYLHEILTYTFQWFVKLFNLLGVSHSSRSIYARETVNTYAGTS